MKPIRTLMRAVIPGACLAAGLALLVPQPARALPNSIGFGNGFLGAAGMPFEDFIASTAPWGRDAPLKGDWAPVATPGTRQALRLVQTAVVFGLPAKEVTVEKEDKTVVLAKVRFTEEKADAGNLSVRLRRAIAAWAGADFAENASTLTARGITLEVSGGAQTAEVVIRKAAK